MACDSNARIANSSCAVTNDDHRHVGRATFVEQLRQHPEPIEPRHLHVEEQHMHRPCALTPLRGSRSVLPRRSRSIRRSRRDRRAPAAGAAAHAPASRRRRRALAPASTLVRPSCAGIVIVTSTPPPDRGSTVEQIGAPVELFKPRRDVLQTDAGMRVDRPACGQPDAVVANPQHDRRASPWRSTSTRPPEGRGDTPWRIAFSTIGCSRNPGTGRSRMSSSASTVTTIRPSKRADSMPR